MSQSALNQPTVAVKKRARQPQRARATIESLNYDGRGVAHIDGHVVFVDYALPGEEVEVEFRRLKRQVYEGQVKNIIRASADRVAPRCPHFGVCGGCSLQHLRSTAQVPVKEQVLRDNLEHIAKVNPQTWLPPLSGEPWGYRSKARLGLRLVPKKGGLLLGFRERRSSFVTNLETCYTLDRQIGRLLPALHHCISALSIPDQIPQIEVAVGTNTAALVIRHLKPLTDDDTRQLQKFGAAYNVQIHLQSGGLGSIYCLWPEDPEPLRYELPEENIEYHFLPTDFTQVNLEINRKMVGQVLELMQLQPQDRVIDLFCGLGNFTLPLAKRVLQVLGLEGHPALVDRARSNARLNNISNIDFRPADLYDADAEPPWSGYEFNKLLLDPPRSGAIEVIKKLPAHGPQRIVYVSCNPATLARDCAYLVQQKGYQLLSAGVVDMFPHTSHVESMALFVKDSS